MTGHSESQGLSGWGCSSSLTSPAGKSKHLWGLGQGLEVWTGGEGILGSDLCKGIERQITEHIQERLEGREHSRRLEMKFKMVVYI